MRDPFTPPGKASLPEGPLSPARHEPEAGDGKPGTATPASDEPGFGDTLAGKIGEFTPLIPRLVAARTLESQVALLESQSCPEDYEHLSLMLVAIGFHLQHKDKRPQDALRLAHLRNWMSVRLPEDWHRSSRTGFGRSRYVAEALDNIGGAYANMGEPARALDYFQQAEVWFERDLAERRERGESGKPRFEHLFRQRDPRAGLFESMGRLYGQLGDRDKAARYLTRMQEIDRGAEDVGARLSNLFATGYASEQEGNFDVALRFYHQGLDLAVAACPSHVVSRDVVEACQHLGRVLRRMGLDRRSLHYHRRALDLDGKLNHAERMSHDHMSIGAVLESRPDLGNPIEHYEAALACASAPAEGNAPLGWVAGGGARFRVLDPNLAWNSTTAVGRCLLRAGQEERASHFLSLAAELAEMSRARPADEEHRTGLQARRMEALELLVELQAGQALRLQVEGKVSGGLAIEAWRNAERARSRSLVEVLGETHLRAPEGVPPALLREEGELLDRLKAMRSGSSGVKAESRGGPRAEYDDTLTALEDVWNRMVDASPAAARYTDLRRGRTLDYSALISILQFGGSVPAEETS